VTCRVWSFRFNDTVSSLSDQGLYLQMVINAASCNPNAVLEFKYGVVENELSWLER
jgi:hypothetical protein